LPAARAGLQKSDRLLAADGKPVGSADELRAIVQAKSPGDALAISIERDGVKTRPHCAVGVRQPAASAW